MDRISHEAVTSRVAAAMVELNQAAKTISILGSSQNWDNTRASIEKAAEDLRPIISYSVKMEVLEARVEKLEKKAALLVRAEADLTAAHEYFVERYDIVDGDNEDGRPDPNEEMRLGTMLDETIHKINGRIWP